MRKISKSIQLTTDSYKISHFPQYPDGTSSVYSYLESRGGKFRNNLFFGLQYILKEYLEGQVVTKDNIDEAEEVAMMHFGTNDKSCFNRAGWEKILYKFDGKLPVKIKAVPEGTILPGKNVLMTVENTDFADKDPSYWLTNYLETVLTEVWYPITVATQSWYMKQIISDYLRETGNLDGLPFKLHDFGFRGVSSVETAGIGGAAHLVNFRGTDTLAAIRVARNYYDEPMAGFSIPASEHSTITSWTKDGEVKAFANMLKQYPKGLVACVSDSFDIYKACRELWGEQLRMKVNAREGTLVVRPDSGNPVEVVNKVLTILAEQFGFTTNEKGYKVLSDKVRVIQGDGIDFSMLKLILQSMKEQGWSADNIAFGSGGGLLQKLDRDTLKFAFKCSNIVVNGEARDVYKSPVTDTVKVSKRGRLKLVKFGGLYGTMGESEHPDMPDILETIFENGVVTKEYDLADIRRRADRCTDELRFLNMVE